MKYGLSDLLNYKGRILFMGVEASCDSDDLYFFVLGDNHEFTVVNLTDGNGSLDAINIGGVRVWLERQNTGVDCTFTDIHSFLKMIDEVNEIVTKREGRFLNYDNTALLAMKKRLQVSDETIAVCAGVGKSTVNDLTRGLTKQPYVHTIGRIHFGLHQLYKLKEHRCSICEAVNKK